MPRRRNILVLVAFLAAICGWTAIQVLSVGDTGLLYLLPALVVALPLVLGRYLGEDRIASLAGRPVRERRRPLRAVRLPRGPQRVMHRGGRLVASSMAKRPPPAALQLQL